MPAQAPDPVERAVVIGCGGVLGIAWSIGLVTALVRDGVSVDHSDLWIGASAGSVVAAKLACGFPIEELFEEQVNGTAASHEVFQPYSQSEADAKNQILFDKVRGNLTQARQRIGAWALRRNTPSQQARRSIIAQRLQHADWPAKQLHIVSVNAMSGEPQIWNRHNSASPLALHNVSLVDAVAASCAVPGVWPPVQLRGEHFIDGGLRSMTNADLAASARRVLVISPQGYSDGNPVSGHLRSELKVLQSRGSNVQVIAPDAASLEAIGANILDPSRCAQVATTALRQGHATAATVARLWSSVHAHGDLISQPDPAFT